MTDQEIIDIVQEELESTYIGADDVERRSYDDTGLYIAGINGNNIDILFTIETSDQQFVFGMLDVLMKHYTEQYKEYIVILQFYDDEEEDEDTYVKVTRIWRQQAEDTENNTPA